MAINTRDFGNSKVVAEQIIRDRLQRKAQHKSQRKWWVKWKIMQYIFRCKPVNMLDEQYRDSELYKKYKDYKIQEKLRSKWWNSIIPKIEEGQVIPNGISYKKWNNNRVFAIIFKIYRLKMRLTYKCYTNRFDSYSGEILEKRSFGFTFDFQYN